MHHLINFCKESYGYTRDWCTTADWNIYFDGDDQRYPTLPRELSSDRDCGVYICIYIMTKGLYSNLDELVELFEDTKYYTLFMQINPDTIKYKRKVVSVMIKDAENFIISN